MHTIENEELRVMISDHGAELSGIFDKKNNREVLWNADGHAFFVASVASSKCVTDVSVSSTQINSISRANPCCPDV